MWQSLAQWAAGGGGVAIVWFVYRLVVLAIDGQRQRAQDWRERALAESARADAERARADTREQQLGHVLGRASERV